jgi:radical SAM protein with 4Fe4S-binding SPASM domain
MFDIKFFQKSTPYKDQIVAGNFLKSDADEIERELDTFRIRDPKVFNIETTNYCNMTCIMCPRTELMTRKNIWIKDETFLKVVEQIKPHSNQDLEKFWGFIENTYGLTGDEPNENTFYFRVVSRCVILHGYGEPLLDKKITERIKVCSERGIPTYFSCVPANLTLERAKQVMDAGLTVFKFSIDALDDEWQKKIRGSQNNFDASYQTILEIINLKKERGYKTLLVPTMIALSEDTASRQMHSKFMDLWKGKDVFAYVKSQDNRWLLEEDENMENRSHYETQYCEFPWTSLTVMADGSVVPCTQDYDTEISLGNVNEQTLEEAWNGETYKNLRRMHITGEFPDGHKCNERCDQRKLYQYLK